MDAIAHRLANPFLSLLIGATAFLAGLAAGAIRTRLQHSDVASSAGARTSNQSERQWMG